MLGCMAWDYIPVDRDQRFLLPPDMADWLPEGHLVWFVVDVVAALDLSALHARHPGGRGRAAYHPAMMLGLLVYAYCCGVYSSRKIERLCETDAAFRVLCADNRPDHGTIARFRQAHTEDMAELFCQVLELCRRQGLGEVALVALDGSRVAASASGAANRRRSWIRDEVERMMGEAERVDREEDDLFGDRRGDEVPEGLGPRGAERVARLRECLRQMDEEGARREQRSEEREAREDEAATEGARVTGRKPKGPGPDPVREAERQVVRLRARRDAAVARRERVERDCMAKGRRPHGPKPDFARWDGLIADAEAETARARAQPPVRRCPDPRDDNRVANLTDPDSRVMHTAGGWLQGYNAQAAVSADQVVVAAAVTNNGADVTQFGPMVDAVAANLAGAGVGLLLADAGYLSDDNLTRPGPDRLIATAKARDLPHTEDGPLPPAEEARTIEGMRRRLATKEGAELYKRRSTIVEPVFGQVKHDRGFRRFSRRGLPAVDAEWKLLCVCHNILKLFGATVATA